MLKTEAMKTIRFELDRLSETSPGNRLLGRDSRNSQRGFTLIELLGVAMIFSILAFLSLNLYNSVRARGQLSETRDRLKLITAKVKQYYETHERLPQGAGPTGNEVPVQPGALDMEQKYRLDGWGRYFRYEYDQNSDPPLTNIQFIPDGSGRLVAARIVSDGPDQIPDTADDAAVEVFVDLAGEAKRVTQNKLRLLQEKVAAYDALFAGVDNDGDGVVDDVDDVGDAAEPRNMVMSACPPINSFNNDPSDGASTLDCIERGVIVPPCYNYNCPTTPPPNPLDARLIYRLADLYDLPTMYLTDAWGQPFLWGHPDLQFNDGSPILNTDRRYHRFFSCGPDKVQMTEDDMTVAAQ